MKLKRLDRDAKIKQHFTPTSEERKHELGL
jgi:hypothetical protein